MSLVDFGQVEFKSVSLMKLSLQAEKILKANTDILVLGAPGTGKTSWARKLSARRGQSDLRIFEGREFRYEEFFNEVNESSCDTVIIEDIDQLSFSDQSKLLLWLDNPTRKAKAVFTSRTVLSDLVNQQDFRSDLYFRISVATLKLPEIKEMREDLPTLVRHLLGVYGILHNKPGLSLSEEALRKVCDWTWPGNFSELENVLEKAVLLSESSQINADDIEIAEGRDSSHITLPIKKLAEVERDLILQTLKVTDQNRTRAAEILGISIRTLRNKIQEYRQEGMI